MGEGTVARSCKGISASGSGAGTGEMKLFQEGGDYQLSMGVVKGLASAEHGGQEGFRFVKLDAEV